MATLDQKKKLFKAKIAVALHSELGRVPKRGRNRADVFVGKSDVQGSAGTSLSKTRAEETRPDGDILVSAPIPLFTLVGACPL
jgi:hypothetical protein